MRCHLCSTICIFFVTNHQPLFHICITLPVELAPFFVPSTSSCSLSSWFTSSCIASLQSHLRSVTSLRFFLHTLKLICFSNPFLLCLSGSIWTAFTDRGLGPDLWALAFVYFLYLYSPHGQQRQQTDRHTNIHIVNTMKIKSNKKYKKL